MIYLGLNEQEKKQIIMKYYQTNKIKKIYFLSPTKFMFEFIEIPKEIQTEWISWSDIIMYKVFYRLLQEIDDYSLIIINECLRTQNRHDLTYNCIRHYLYKAKHQLIFQYLPIIEKAEDFFILFDFDTKSIWKQNKDFTLLKKLQTPPAIKQIKIKINRIDIQTDEKTKQKYFIEKEKLINNIGLGDPHIIPRKLHLIGGQSKYNFIINNSKLSETCILKMQNLIDKSRWYIGRNKRYDLPNFNTFKESKFTGNNYIIFEICHNFIDFIDFLTLTKQTEFDMIVTDLKVDNWYFERYQSWLGEIENVYSIL